MSVVKVTCDDKKHIGDVTSIIYHNGHLFSAGSDAKIKVGKLQKILNLKISFRLLIDLGQGPELHSRVEHSRGVHLCHHCG